MIFLFKLMHRRSRLIQLVLYTANLHTYHFYSFIIKILTAKLLANHLVSRVHVCLFKFLVKIFTKRYKYYIVTFILYTHIIYNIV